MESLKEKLFDLALEYGPRLLVAVLTIIIGFAVVNGIINGMDRVLKRNKIDQSLHSFFKAVSSFILKVIVFIIAATILGVPMTTFVAMLSAAGLAIGLALKNSLANFAGGILILIFRPFNVGDFIETQGYSGTVKDIQLLYTYINTGDNRRVTIPNGELSNAKIINYSVEDTRRLDLLCGVRCDDDIQKAKDVLAKIVAEHPLTLKDPEPVIRPMTYTNNTIDLTVKIWCKREDYWTVYYDLHEVVKIELEKENITILFLQLNANTKE